MVHGTFEYFVCMLYYCVYGLIELAVVMSIEANKAVPELITKPSIMPIISRNVDVPTR